MVDGDPGTSPATAVPVSAVNAAVRELLESSIRPLWVKGEIGSWRRHGSGHCYFSLRDQGAQLSCVMFRSDARALPADPEEGMEICALGRVTVYEAGGKYQLVVRSLEALGEGLWRLAFERLRTALAAEGLLDPARKRPIPAVPARVGVVTSRSGAALRDVLAVIRRRAPWTKVLLSGCRVQGRDAAPEIVAALNRIERHGGCDVVIVTRGGGSVEDLWAFNEESVARAIADCSIPVVSAIGHEIDFTIADLVADARAPTPSAAAEAVVPEATVLVGRLRDLSAGLRAGLRRLVGEGRERARHGGRRLLETIRRSLSERDSRMAVASGRLDALSPLATLSRGYAVALGDDGVVLRAGESFVKDSHFDLRVVDAIVGCRVEDVRAVPEAGRE
jgi:exodeoxyribonuclease VII large subunit